MTGESLYSILVFLLTSSLSFLGFSQLERWYRRKQLLKRTGPTTAVKAMAANSPGTGPWELALALGRLAVPKKETEISMVTRQLIHAGFRNDQALQLYYGIRIAAGGALTLMVLIPWMTLGHFDARHTVLAFIPFTMGYFLPAMVLKQRVKSREAAIFKELPDTLDLLSICLKAGLGFDFALYRVCQELADIAPILSLEFSLFFLEIKGGLAREEALDHLQARNPSEPLKNVVTVLLQSARSGTDMANALKTYTENMRTERRQKAEEQAGKLSTKLTLPLVIFILPALMLIILGPTIINFISIVKDGF